MGGGIFANPDARHPFASEGRTYSKGILLEGKHGFGPKSSRTKLTEKPELESSGRQFCRLGKKLSFRQEKLLFRQEFGAVRGRPELPNGVLSTLRLAPVGWVSPPRVLNMRVKWLGETKPAASAISVMVTPGVQEHHSRRFPKRIMALHGRQPRFLIPEHPRNIAAENPPVIFRFGDAFSGEELSSANAGAVPVA